VECLSCSFADQYELITDTSDIYTVNKEDFLPLDLPLYITATVINKHIVSTTIYVTKSDNF